MRERISLLSRPPQCHFFGYHGMNAWSPDGREHLALQTTFDDHRPTAEDVAEVGLVDSSTGHFRRLGETPAFNLQQGSMLHWVRATGAAECTYNDWTGEALVTRAVNPVTGAARTLQGAIAAVSPTAPVAIGLNFRRMFQCRPVVGYAVEPQASAEPPFPEDDGLYLMDLLSGEQRLLLSIADVVAKSPQVRREPGPAWFNHVYFSPSGRRLIFMCRVNRPPAWRHSLWSIRVDGSDLRCLLDYDNRTSHFAWIDESHILCSTTVLGRGIQFVRLEDAERGGNIVPEGEGLLPPDGHACFSPDGRQVACDGNAGGRNRLAELMLYRPADRTKTVLGRFAHPAHYTGDIRCDLHPRWHPNGQVITFDSLHEGTRQIYQADVSDLVGH